MKRFIKILLSSIMLISLLAQTMSVFASTNLKSTTIEKSNAGNPMLGFDENGALLYGGDPSILVDGDTVYAYVGHDASETDYYSMPDWRCYSSKDMISWKYESIILKNSEIEWAVDPYDTAWAAQVIKYNEKYYFYYCIEGNGSVGSGKCIGVAVSDSPTGPFVDIGQPLVKNVYDTEASIGGWEDIDPTVWVENVDGEEHRIIGWGNSRLFNAELNEDMISIKDQNGDGYINIRGGDIKLGQISNMDDHSNCLVNNDQGITCSDVLNGRHYYTEAPYYYRQQDENGNYYGKYYMFFACDWREQMAYATADTYSDFKNNRWQFGGVIQEPSTTSNTNHMAVFDFKGQSYFVYHTGSLPHGSGYRRVACVEPFEVNQDGTIDYIKKTAVGLNGTAFTLENHNGGFVSHKSFTNFVYEDIYPVKAMPLEISSQENVRCSWSFNEGKSNSSAQYVSIESNNKPGLFISAEKVNGVITPVLSQDINATSDEAKAMTFKTYQGANNGVILESVMFPGYYLANVSGKLALVHSLDYGKATFYVATAESALEYNISKTKTLYQQGEALNDDDIQIIAYTAGGKSAIIEDYTTNASDIDMSTTGMKKLRVSFCYGAIRYSREISINVSESAYFSSNAIASFGLKKEASGVDYNDYLVASYTFESSTYGATVGTTGNNNSDISTYKYPTRYTDGHNGGKAIQLNECGVRLNQKKLGSEYTISFWIMPDRDFVDNQVIMFLGYHNPEKWMALSGTNGPYTKFWANGGVYQSWTNFTFNQLNKNEWNNVTLSDNGDIASLYINGIKLAEVKSNQPLTAEKSDIYIGVNRWDKCFNGCLDDVLVFNKALDEYAIQNMSLSEYQNSFDKYFNSVINSIDISGNNKSLDNVKYDLDFVGEMNSLKLEWSSDNKQIISDSGKVFNPTDNDQIVNITVSATSGILSASAVIPVKVEKLGDNDVSNLCSIAENMDTSLFTKPSVDALNNAVSYAKSAQTETEYAKAKDMLTTAIKGLSFIKEFENPFSLIELPEYSTSKVLGSGKSITLIDIPDSIKNYIDVEYDSSDTSIATFDNGILKTLKNGKAVVTASVTSDCTEFCVNYSFAINVTGITAVLSVADAIDKLPCPSALKKGDKATVDNAFSYYSALTTAQKNEIGADLTAKLIDDSNRISELCANVSSKVIGSSGHTYKNVITKATLTKNGKIVPTCSCGDTKTATAIYYPKTIALSATVYNYDGKVKTPAVTVKDAKGKTLVKNTDYTVSYASGRKLVGKYAVKITFKGNYSGTKTLYFTIRPKNTTFSITSGKKAFTAKMKKYTTQTTGYQIQYATNAKFTSAKTVTVKNTVTSKTISKLAGGKKYYVRVRTYKTVKINGKNTNIYSAWSSAKAVTTKK